MRISGFKIFFRFFLEKNLGKNSGEICGEKFSREKLAEKNLGENWEKISRKKLWDFFWKIVEKVEKIWENFWGKNRAGKLREISWKKFVKNFVGENCEKSGDFFCGVVKNLGKN